MTPTQFDTPIGHISITHKAGCSISKGEGCDCGPAISIDGRRLTAKEITDLTAEADVREETQERLLARIGLKHEPDCSTPHALDCQCEVRFTLDGKTLRLPAKLVRWDIQQRASELSPVGLTEAIINLMARAEKAEAALAQDPVPAFEGQPFTRADLTEFVVAARVGVAIFKSKLRADLAAAHTPRPRMRIPEGRRARKPRGGR